MNREEKRANGNGQTSRRKFLKDAGLIVGGVTVGSIGIMSACKGGPEPPTAAADNATPNITNNVTASVNTAGNVTSTANTTTPPPPPKLIEAVPPQVAVDLELFNPSGNQEITQFFAPRLSTLEGKTIAFLACDPVKWQPHRIFPVIMEELKKLYPTIKFLPATQFPQSTSISNDSVIQAVANLKVDAVITGAAG